MNIVKTFKKKPLSEIKEGLITGLLPMAPIEVKEEELNVKWNGTKVPAKIIREFTSFARYVTNKYGGECQGRLYYDTKKDEWSIAIVKQYISTGLTSKECGDDGDIEEALKGLPDGNWVQNGTIHSHCNIDAFMSGTDEKDEQGQAGIHITVGKLDQDEFDIHSRLSYLGTIFQFGSGKQHCLDDRLSLSTSDLGNFPNEWKERLVEKPAPVFVRSNNNSAWFNSYTSYVGRGFNNSYNPQKPRSTYNISDEQLLNRLVNIIKLHRKDSSVSGILYKLYEIQFNQENEEFICELCGSTTDVEYGLCNDCAGDGIEWY